MFNRTFAIEIETAGTMVTPDYVARKLRETNIEAHEEPYNHSVRTYWKLVPDGSLSGRNSFELVSPILRGAEGIETIKQVCKVLNECHVNVNKSCGMHVHIGASDLNVKQLRNLVAYYGRVEEHIDSLMPESRRKNQNYYAKSMLHHDSTTERFLTRIDHPTTMEELMRSVCGLNQRGNYDRYRKVNLLSLPRYGTIEFRQHAGTTNADKIVNWIQMLHAIVERSTTIHDVKAFTRGSHPTLAMFLRRLGLSSEIRSWFVSRQRAVRGEVRMGIE